MTLSQLRHSGHWPTLLASVLYFDVSLMIVLTALAARMSGAHRSAQNNSRS